jgi:enoyl-[acyl-carrier protein] reductase II
MPLWKLLAGMLAQFDKIRMLSLFGAATEKLKAATVEGDLDKGVQFIGQTQGIINDVETVQILMDRIINESETVALQLAKQHQGV